MLDPTRFIKNSRLYFNNLILETKQFITLDKQTQKFINHNQKVWANWKKKNSQSVVLVDLYGVSETLISYSYFLNVLAKKHNAIIKSFGRPRIIPNRTLHKIFESFNTSGHIIPSLNNKQRRRQEIISKKIIPKLKIKKQVFDLKVLDVWIGIDIYETYLRKYNQPTIFLDDPKLIKLIKKGIGLVIFWQDFFCKNQVVAVVVSHDCYLHLDIVNKVAYKKKVPVYLPNIRGISYADRPFSVHSYFKNYKNMFRKISPQEQKKGIAWAKKQLKRRLSGEVGVDMPYSTKSAFQKINNKKRVLRKSINIKVLICSHCFFDNPHGYGGMLFLDFYEWLHFLGKISKRTNYDWYLKIHPDPLPGTIETIKNILKDFPKITIIPHETSHNQLVKEGINFVLTAYGTVGHECPALGAQIINAAYNPRVAYDFNWHPKTKKEYENLLLNLDKLHKKINLNELYEFYYMHYHYVLADDLILKSYRQSLADLNSKERIGSKIYEYFLSQFTSVKHQEIIDKMQKFINSGKHHYFSQGPE